MAFGGPPLGAVASKPLVGRQEPVNAPRCRQRAAAPRSARACRSRRTSRQLGTGSRQSVGDGVYALFQAAALQDHHRHQ